MILDIKLKFKIEKIIIIIKNNQGQAMIEYVLMMAIILGIYLGVSKGISRLGLDKKITNSITTTFSAAYRYGHVKAKGYDDGGPAYHPRADTGGGNNNFRVFFNPDH